MREKRLDIQGLRALAVLLVVTFHLWPDRLSGGYVGVDVFFVISGFLITGHLLSEVERTGTVSLTKFWARRVRRLLPAAFTVLGASLVAAFVILPKSLLQQTLYEIGAAALYVQNWVLAGNSVDYLAADNKPSLAQHYWSLSVEEQFYIAWPILIIVAVWVAARTRRGRSLNRQSVAIALSIVFITSLAYSVFETARSQPSAYFITPTRAWEFAAGGLLVFIPAIAARPMLRAIASWGGVALILYAAVTFDGGTAFPGAIALLPVVGTMLLIYAGDSDSVWSPAHVFRFGPIQLLGDISYAVYLWHWPLIILAPFMLGQELTLRTKLMLLVITFALAIATKFLIEDPVRFAKGRARRRAPAFAFMAVGIAVLVGISGFATLQIGQVRAKFESQVSSALGSGTSCFGAFAMVKANSCERPFAVTQMVDPGFTSTDIYKTNGSTSGNTCLNNARGGTAPMKGCELGETTNPKVTIAVVGDSHADALLNPLVTYAKGKGWRIVAYIRGSCAGLEDPRVSSNVTSLATKCLQWGQQVRAEIEGRQDIDAVAFANQLRGKNIASAGVIQKWDRIRESGKSVMVIRDVPGLSPGSTAPECVELHMESYDPCSSQLPKRDYMLESAERSRTLTPVIDLSDLICTGDTCHSVIGGVIVYADGNHLSVTFAQTLTPFLGDRITDALASVTRSAT